MVAFFLSYYNFWSYHEHWYIYHTCTIYNLNMRRSRKWYQGSGGPYNFFCFFLVFTEGGKDFPGDSVGPKAHRSKVRYIGPKVLDQYK